VLRHRALPLQLSGWAAGALASGHAQPVDPRRCVLGTGAQWLSAQWLVHLSPALRWLPGLPALAHSGGAVCTAPKPEAGLESPCAPVGARAAAELPARTL